MKEEGYFKDDLEPVKESTGTFDYICSKCGKVEKSKKSIFHVNGKDLCMECWFHVDYKVDNP